jgi:hypothetical protein
VAVIAVRFPAQGPIDPAVSVALPEQDWLPVFGGRACQAGPVPVAELCASLPVAVLEAG